MKALNFLVCIMFAGTFAFAQQIDKSQVPMSVKKMLFTKIHDTLTPTWVKESETYHASYINGELTAVIDIKQTGEWLKTVWSLPYKYVPQKIKDNILANYEGYKTLKVTIQYRLDGDYYVVDIKKKKDTKTLLYNIKGEFVKNESETTPPVPVPTNK